MTNGEFEREKREFGKKARKTFIRWAEERVSALPTSGLLLGIVIWSCLAWGQDSIVAAASAIPGLSAIAQVITDSGLVNLDEAFLGIPWFLMLAELGRRVFVRENEEESS